jgi:hypothetical protein
MSFTGGVHNQQPSREDNKQGRGKRRLTLSSDSEASVPIFFRMEASSVALMLPLPSDTITTIHE